MVGRRPDGGGASIGGCLLEASRGGLKVVVVSQNCLDGHRQTRVVEVGPPVDGDLTNRDLSGGPGHRQIDPLQRRGLDRRCRRAPAHHDDRCDHSQRPGHARPPFDLTLTGASAGEGAAMPATENRTSDSSSRSGSWAGW